MPDSLKKCLEQRLAQLKTERESWIPQWRDLSEQIQPRMGRFLISDTNKGDRRNQKIINNTPTMASRIMMGGLSSGLTSPARPWFQLATPDPDMMEYGPVKEWLYAVQKIMAEMFVKSNLYNVLPTCYLELAVFGTTCMSAMPDKDELIRFYPFTTGSFMIAQNSRQRVDTVYREFRMTARQLVDQFGLEAVSISTRQLYENGSGEQWVDVVHACEPNNDRKAGMMDKLNMPYRSVYFEKSGDADKLLRVGGFEQFPMMAPRWDVNAEDIYGTSPGMVCLGDARALQLLEKKKLKLLDKGVDPAMLASSNMRNQRLSILPGDVTYGDDMNGSAPLRPIHEVNPGWFQGIRAEIEQHEQRINSAFFADLFLMISQIERSNVTATEIAVRKEEKMLMLGPVLERLNDELLDPLIDRAFGMLLEQSSPRWLGLLPGKPMLPPPPEELNGMDLRVEYISILAQAQKALGVGSIERAVGFAGTLVNITQNPAVLDKLNADKAIEEYFGMLGVPPTIVNSDEDVQAIREGRQAEQANALAQQQLGAVIEGAKSLSETDTSGQNALTSLAGIV